MCSDRTASLLREKSPEFLSNFKWNQLELELGMHAPTLSQILHACFTTRVPRKTKTYMVCMCAAMMFKNRRPSMSLLQKIISVILYIGHCSKQV